MGQIDVPDTTDISYGSTVKIRWLLPGMNQNSDWFKVYIFGQTIAYKDTFDVRSWYIRPQSPDTMYAFIPAAFPYGLAYATMTHLDSLGRESDFSNRAYFTMRFGPPVIIDLNFE